MAPNQADQPEARISPDGGKIAVRWLSAPIDTRELNGDTTPRWRVVCAGDLMGTHESDEAVEGWQPLAPLADSADEVEDLRRQLRETRKAHGIDKGKLHIAEKQRELDQDRIRALEGDIENRWQAADIDETVKAELRRRTAELDVYRSSLHDALEVWTHVQFIGVTRLGLKLGFYADALDRALENQAREIERLRAELAALPVGYDTTTEEQ